MIGVDVGKLSLLMSSFLREVVLSRGEGSEDNILLMRKEAEGGRDDMVSDSSSSLSCSAAAADADLVDLLPLTPLSKDFLGANFLIESPMLSFLSSSSPSKEMVKAVEGGLGETSVGGFADMTRHHQELKYIAMYCLGVT